MPVPYSVDLRWRVVCLHLVHHMTFKNISKLLFISEKTVRRYLRRFWQTGEMQPQAHRNGPAGIFGDYEKLILLRIVLAHPGIFLFEIKDMLQEHFGVLVSEITILRALKSMGCTRQVIRQIPIQRSEMMRAKFMAEISVYDPSMLVWLDESGCDRRNAIRKYGYSVRGMRPVEYRIFARGVRYSAIPIMSISEIHDVFLAEGTVNGDRFKYFVQTSLLPVLQPFNTINPLSVVIMDNASIHHVQSCVDLIENDGSRVIFLPPYSPDLNPLEPVFCTVKSILKANDKIIQTCTSPRSVIAMAFSTIDQQMCINFCQHCGYIL